jgi:hypothetical protein
MHLEARWIDGSVPAWRVHAINDVDHLGTDARAALQVEG